MISRKILGVMIVLKDGYKQKRGTAIEAVCTGKKEKLSEDSYQVDYSKGRCRYVLVHCSEGFYPIRVKNSQINWIKTVKANEELLNKNEMVVDNLVEA